MHNRIFFKKSLKRTKFCYLQHIEDILFCILNCQRKIDTTCSHLFEYFKNFNSHKQKQNDAFLKLSGSGSLFKLYKDSVRQVEYFW